MEQHFPIVCLKFIFEDRVVFTGSAAPLDELRYIHDCIERFHIPVPCRVEGVAYGYYYEDERETLTITGKLEWLI